MLNKVKIEINDGNVSVMCPYCDMWEEMGVDEPRKGLHNLPIIQWVSPVGGIEQSLHNCTGCGKSFFVEWDYNNASEGD